MISPAKACLSAAATVLAALACAFGATPALAAQAAPQWVVSATSTPTNIAPGGAGAYIVTAVNNGAPTDGSTITVADALPAGMTATGIHSFDAGTFFKTFAPPYYETPSCELSTLECTYSGVVTTGDMVEIVIEVEATGPFTEAQPTDTATVSGGGAPECGGAGQPACASASDPTTISATPASFGLASITSAISGAQAGAHPNLTVGFTLNQSRQGDSAGFAKSIGVDLPPGVIGNPTATPRCSMSEVISDTCNSDAAVGLASALVKAHGSETEADPGEFLVYNVKPYPGEPAAFAFDIIGNVAVRLDTSVRSGGDYGVHVSVEDLSELEDLVASSVTLWGVPQRHNGPGRHESPFEAGFEPVPSGLDNTLIDDNYTIVSFGAEGHGKPTPFLRSPTACGAAQEVALSTVSWPGEGGVGESSMRSPLSSPSGCEGLPFRPAIGLKATSSRAGAPAGYEVAVDVPQSANPQTLATPDVRDVEVSLPEGTALSPSAANGLDSCSEAQFGLHSGVEGKCPSASQIGSVKITTPLLALPLEGHVYLGEPECAPCSAEDAGDGKMVPLLLEAEGSGVVVKLKGHTSVNQQTGRITTSFNEDPQLPFSELTLKLKGGEDAPLVNPSTCGPAVATAKLTPWSSLTPTEVMAPSIPIEGCSASKFTPSLRAGMTKSARGGTFSPFSVTIARPDGDQPLGTVAIHTPPGISGMLSKVPLCGEAQANAGTCPAASQIGTTTAVIGPGTRPYTVEGGKVYLTEKYGGGSFGLSIVTPAKAGPFTLSGLTGTGAPGDGSVVVRASIEVDPHTAALTIKTNPLPTQLDGIPLDIDKVIVNVNREGFMFNPTSCNAMSVTGTLDSSSGTAASVSYPFQSTDCASLAFKPSFSVSTQAKVSRKDGASLKVMITQKPGEANLHKVDVQLPKILPSREETLKLACTAAQFESNPAACPAESKVGEAVVHTPILSSPLQGPAILVSHGGVAFPDLDLVLQGEGITIIATGHTQISKKGITYSRFETIPDAPISSMELNLPEGKYSILGAPAAKGSLCGRNLVMPTTIVGQNGAQIEELTRIKPEGCSNTLSVRGHHIKKRTLTLKIYVPTAGRLHVGGKGIRGKTRKIHGMNIVTVKVHEKRPGKLKTRVLIRFKAAGKGVKRQTKRFAVKFHAPKDRGKHHGRHRKHHGKKKG